MARNRQFPMDPDGYTHTLPPIGTFGTFLRFSGVRTDLMVFEWKCFLELEVVFCVVIKTSWKN